MADSERRRSMFEHKIKGYEQEVQQKGAFKHFSGADRGYTGCLPSADLAFATFES